MKSEPISFQKEDIVRILPTPLNQAKHDRSELKGLELEKEYVVFDAHRKWEKWYVSVKLENDQHSEFVSGELFAKK